MSAPALAGRGSAILRLVSEQWAPLTDETHVSPLGSLHALKRGQAASPRRSVMIAAHMDAVGFVVTGLQGDFLRAAAIGSLDARVLPGTPVVVHGARDLPAVIVPAASAGGAHGAPAPSGASDWLVDTGQRAAQLKRLARPGDAISFGSQAMPLGNRWVSGRSIDNRASLAAITFCLEMLQSATLGWDLWAVATTREETDYGGALTSTHALAPSVAVGLDTTFGKAPGTDGWNAFALDSGPTITTGPNSHPALHRKFRELAEALSIPYSVEAIPASSDTDTMAMQVARSGIPTMLIEIPIRYMHTPVEVVSIDDIENAGRLLAAFVTTADDPLEEILEWDA